VLAVAVAADNARFASGGGDRAVLVWDVAASGGGHGKGGGVVRRLEGHGARVNDVAWGGDGVIVSGECWTPSSLLSRGHTFTRLEARACFCCRVEDG
jgi:WD40 repeat protein